LFDRTMIAEFFSRGHFSHVMIAGLSLCTQPHRKKQSAEDSQQKEIKEKELRKEQESRS
jgi:hypothetical protein